MINEEAIRMLEAKLECMTRDVSGTDYNCNHLLCDECRLNYEQGDMGEQKEYTRMSIEALEREPKTGHWIATDEEPHEDYECDGCGYTISTYTANIEPHTEYKYCPNCGAKMEEVEE